MIVQRRGGTVALKAVTEAIKQVQLGTDKTAAELAIVRLEREYSILQSQLGQIPLPSSLARLLMRLFFVAMLLPFCALLAGVIGLVSEGNGLSSSSTTPIVNGMAFLVFAGLDVWLIFSRVKGATSVDPRRSALEAQLIHTYHEIEKNRAIVQGGTAHRRCPSCRSEVGVTAKHCHKCGILV